MAQENITGENEGYSKLLPITQVYCGGSAFADPWSPDVFENPNRYRKSAQNIKKLKVTSPN